MKLAVIPARGGSKRTPRKNIRPFLGKPMIAYAIEAARAAGVFDRIVVSTDDPEIAEIAQRQGAELPFMRPAELADDHAGTVEVIAHAITAMRERGFDCDAACCIYPCVPMLEPGDLRLAGELLEQGDCDYAFPVAEFPSPVQRALQRDGAGHTHSIYPEHALTRSQDLPRAFHDAGQFYWGRVQAWLAGKHPHLNARSIVLPAWRVVDIDTPDDWERAEALYRVQRLQAG